MWGFNVVEFETPSVHVNTYMCVCLCSLPPPPPDLGSITLFAAITIILGCLKIGYFVGFSECLSATEGVFPVTHAVHTLLQVKPTVIVHVALASVECIPGWMWNGMRWGGAAWSGLASFSEAQSFSCSTVKWVSLSPWPSLWESYEVELVTESQGIVPSLSLPAKSCGGDMNIFYWVLLSCNSHTTQFTPFKCMSQWFGIFMGLCNHHHNQSSNIFITPERNPVPLRSLLRVTDTLYLEIGSLWRQLRLNEVIWMDLIQ